MKYYTETISVTLAEKLKEKGMPIEAEGDNVWCPSYAEVLDWLESQQIGIGIKHHWSGIVYQGYDWQICQLGKTIKPYFGTFYGTWHEVADTVIEKALELIKEESK